MVEWHTVGHWEMMSIGGRLVRHTSLRGIAILLISILLLAACAPAPTATPLPMLTATPMPVPTVMYGPEVPPTLAVSPTRVVPPTNASQPTAQPAPTKQAIQPQGKPQPPAAGQIAYEFSLPDLAGNAVALSDFRGKKVMLNFWATWCGPCRFEIPHMVKLYDEIRDEGFEIVAVNLREDPTKVTAFVEQFEMEFPILLDAKGQAGSAYFVRGIPTSVFLDEEGIIEAVHTGTLTDEKLREYVSALMQ